MKPFKWPLLALVLVLLICQNLHAQTYSRLQGWCEDGNQTVTTAGLSSTTRVQRSFPGCTVTVYNSGTITLSTIYSNSTGTPKANPFTASSSNGQWNFYAAPGHFDVNFAGGGISSPFTIGDVFIPGAFDSLSANTIILNGQSMTPTGIAGKATLYANTSGVLYVCQGVTCIPVVGSGSISGTLTTNFLPKATSSTVLGNTRVQEDVSVPGSEVLKVNERLLVNENDSDVPTGALVSVGAIREVNSAVDAQMASLYALGGGSGRVFLDSSHTGVGATKPIALSIDGAEAVQVSIDPIMQLTGSYAGANRSSAGTVALRNNNGVLEKSENGAAWVGVAGGSTLSGTPGTLVKFGSTNSGVDSLILEDTSGCPGACVIKIPARVLANGTASDVPTGALVALGTFTEANSATNAQTLSIFATGGGSGRAFLNSSHTGTGATKPIALAIDGTEAVQVSLEPFFQLTASYTGATKSAAGTIAIRNNAGVLEKSENGGNWTAIAAGGTVTNSSTTANTFPVLSSATNITDSMLSQPAGPFLQFNTSYTGGTLSSAGKIAFRNNAGSAELSENGGAWTHIGASNLSGTPGTFTKFTGATSGGNSALTEDTGATTINSSYFMRVNATSDDFGVGSMHIVGATLIGNASTNAVMGQIYGAGGGAGRFIINSTHSGAGSTKPLSLQVDGQEVVKVNGGFQSICVYFNGVGLRTLSMDMAGNVIDGGAC